MPYLISKIKHVLGVFLVYYSNQRNQKERVAKLAALYDTFVLQSQKKCTDAYISIVIFKFFGREPGLLGKEISQGIPPLSMKH